MRKLALAALLATAGCGSGIDSTVTINPAESHQTIVAWEATARLWEFDKEKDRFDGSWIADRNRIMDDLIARGGISRIRLEIKSGAENPVDYWTMFEQHRISYNEVRSHFYEKINDDDDPDHINPKGFQFSDLDFRVRTIVLPAMEAAKRHNRRLTLNLNFVDFGWTDRKGSLSLADEPAEYAELIVATLKHLKDRWGLTPDALEIILEPDNSDRWRGAQIGRAIVATAARLKREGIGLPEIIAPSTANAKQALPYLDGIASVPGALPLVGTISYHRYDALPSAQTIDQIGDKAKSLRKRSAMLEHVEGDINELMEDLTAGNVSAWQLYGIAWNGERPGYPLAVSKTADGKADIRLTPVGAYLAELFTHVPPGAVRIGATANVAGLRAVAFRNPDQAEVVMVRPAEAIVNGRWGRFLRMVTPSRDYRVRIVGLAQRAYVARLMNRSGQVRTCGWDGKARLAVSTGETLTIVPARPEEAARALPCSD